MRRASEEPGGLGKTREEVEALHGLSTGAFDNIVLRTEKQQPAGTLIEAPGEFDGVCADHMFGIREGLSLKDTDERFGTIGGTVAFGDLATQRLRLGGGAEMPFRCQVERGENT